MTYPRIGAVRTLLGACVAIAAMMPSPSHAAAKIQHLISPAELQVYLERYVCKVLLISFGKFFRNDAHV